MSIFKKIWHDPVWSKVIAGLIVVIIVGTYSKNQDLNLSEFLIYSFIILFILAIFFLLLYLFKRRANAKEDELKITKPKDVEQVITTAKEVKLKYIATSGNDIVPVKKIEKTAVIDISPEKIVKEIEKVPPFQRNTIAEHYIGLKVEWLLTVRNISKWHENNVFIHLSPKGNLTPNIVCIVPASDFPFIKFAREGDKIRVEGEISKCDSFKIDLTKCKLFKA